MNLKGVLDELDIPYKKFGEHHHTSSPDWVSVDCALCSPGTGKFRLGFNIRWGYCTCWVCGKLPLRETLEKVANKSVGNLLRGLERDKDTYKPLDKPRGKLVLPEGLGQMTAPHRRYLKSRRFDPDGLARGWGLLGLGIAPKLSWRIFIPVEYRGKTVSWTTRSISDEVIRRYVNAPKECESLSLKETVFGIDHCRHSIIVVEGPLDAMRIGFGAGAIMGLVYTKEQVRMISRFPVRVVCFDSEPEAQRRAERLCEDLSCFEGQTHQVELSASDPGEATIREVKRLREHFLE